MPIIRTLLFVSLSTVLITACDLSTNTSNDGEIGLTENPAEATGNPCLEAWAINRMKEHIKERAKELVTAKYSSGTIDSSLLYGADISFDYISQPTTLENGDLSCSAKVIISYVGNNKSTKDLAITYANIVNANIDYNSNPFANAASGYIVKQELASIGINEFNINEFSDISGNKFATEMEYELRTTYSENGDEQQSYQAAIGKPAAMLATIALLDNFIQKNKRSDSFSSAESTEGQANKADSYYDEYDEYHEYDEEVEDVEDFQDDPVVITPQKQKATESEQQKVKDVSAARPTTKVNKEKTEPVATNKTVDDSKYNTTYVDEDNKYDTAYVYD